MKKYLKLVLLIAVGISLTISSCKKDDTQSAASGGSATPETFTSLYDLYNRYGQPTVSHIINSTTGGTFTTAQGTIVIIPPGAFVDNLGGAITGNVTIEFKDIYKKSDMLLSNKPTNSITGWPLKSGGEFWIMANQSGTPVNLANGKKITVKQPTALTGGLDAGMVPFIDTVSGGMSGIAGFNNQWLPATPLDSLYINATSYVFSLYSFTSPTVVGSWCNSDNSSYFSAYPQTSLTMHTTDTTYNTDVFLVFTSINAMVHVYQDWSHQQNFPYLYAPTGLQCTVVAVGTKNGNLYSSFTPITIGTNMTVNFTLSPTTSYAFRSQLTALN
jgi:outer membrane protein assembly factor BamB